MQILLRYFYPTFNRIVAFGIIEFFLICFAAANVLTFLLFVIDKRKAIAGKRRIRERTLAFFALMFGGIGAVLGMWLANHKTTKRKFKIIVSIGLIITLIPVIHVVHSLTLDRIVRYVEIEFRSENWNPELDGYRIAFMTDKHTISDEDMRAIADELSNRNIDLLLLGGDFASPAFSPTHFEGTVREISRTVTTDGIFGVYGNHDTRRLLAAAKDRYGIVQLDNEGLHIRDGFYLTGVRNYWTGFADISAAIADANDGDFTLLISHNPDIAMTQSTAGVDLILSGHTHGGQVTLFGFPIYLMIPHITRHRLRFAYGFGDSADGVPVFTSRGTGPYYGIPRIWARPEVVIFTMYSE